MLVEPGPRRRTELPGARTTTDTELDFAEITAGAIYQPSETLQVSGGIGWAKRKRYDTIDGDQQTTQNNTGPSVRGAFTYTIREPDLPRQRQLHHRRPRPAALRRAPRRLRAAARTLSGRVFQNYTGTDTGGDEARVTGVGVSWLHNINEVSSFGLDFAWALQVDVDNTLLDPAQPDIHRTNVTATYSHAITNAVSGLTRLPLPPVRPGAGQRDEPRGLHRGRPQLRDQSLKPFVPGGSPPGRTPGPRSEPAPASRERNCSHCSRASTLSSYLNYNDKMSSTLTEFQLCPRPCTVPGT